MNDPTVVLVHGAFADASGWAGVIRELQRDHAVVAPPNPLRGLHPDAASIAAVVWSPIATTPSRRRRSTSWPGA